MPVIQTSHLLAQVLINTTEQDLTEVGIVFFIPFIKSFAKIVGLGFDK